MTECNNTSSEEEIKKPAFQRRKSLRKEKSSGNLSKVSLASSSQILSPKRSASLAEIRSMKIPHSIMYWHPVSPGQETIQIDDADLVDQSGVPRGILYRYVRQQMEEFDAFLSLPFAIALLFVYGMCFINHNAATIVADVEHAIGTDLHENAVFAYTDPGYMAHKDLDDVHNAQDVWSWLRIGLLPLLFKQYRTWSELSTDAPLWPDMLVPNEGKYRYLQFNRLIGGLQLTQMRGEERGTCDNEQVANALRLSCSPASDVVSVNLNLEPEPFDIRAHQFPVDPKLDIFFLVNDDKGKVELRLRQLELTDWIDNTTIQAAANFMTYNAHFDVLTKTQSLFFFSRSGKLWKLILHSSFVLTPYRKMDSIIWDLIFVVMLLWVLCNEFWGVFQTIRYALSEGGCKGIRRYFNVWNFVDWLLISSGVLLMVLWGIHVNELKTLKDLVVDVAAVDANTQSWIEQLYLEELVRKTFASFTYMDQHAQGSLKILSSWFPMVLTMRLFKAFNAQPKLALFQKTMVRAAGDLFHFGLVFMAVFVAFTMVAHGLFARNIVSFRTFGGSFATCFAALMGDFDIVEMREAAGRTISMLWFMSFQVMSALLLLNMIIAIVMDIYTDVKSHVRDNDGLDSQLRKLIWHRSDLQSGKRVSLRKLAHHLRYVNQEVKLSSAWLPHHGPSDWYHEVYTVNDFANIVPVLSIKQARRTMIHSVRDFRIQHEPPMGLGEAMVAIGRIQNQLQGVLLMEQQEVEHLEFIESHTDEEKPVPAVHEAALARDHLEELETPQPPAASRSTDNSYIPDERAPKCRPKWVWDLNEPGPALVLQRLELLETKQDLCMKTLAEVVESNKRLEKAMEALAGSHQGSNAMHPAHPRVACDCF